MSETNRDSTHWESCWRDGGPQHYACAVAEAKRQSQRAARVSELEKLVADCHDSIVELRQRSEQAEEAIELLREQADCQHEYKIQNASGPMEPVERVGVCSKCGHVTPASAAGEYPMAESTFVRDVLLFSVIAMGSQKAAAEQWGVSEQYLSDVLSGRRQPGAKLCAGVGYERVISYRRTQP